MINNKIVIIEGKVSVRMQLQKYIKATKEHKNNKEIRHIFSCP